jgi:hypothetical protein
VPLTEAGLRVLMCEYGRATENQSYRKVLSTEYDGGRDELWSVCRVEPVGDEPQSAHGAGDALLILGNHGAYAQVGDRPSSMTPCKRLPGSAGVANGLASCSWRDEAGRPAVAYLDKSGEAVWLVTVSSAFDGETGFRLLELSAPVRGKIRAFLADGQSLTNFDTARMEADEATGSLWLIQGSRAIVFRRPSVVDGSVPIEFYSYSLGGSGRTFPYIAFSTKRRAVAATSEGRLVEFDWNSSTGAWITGANRDDGQAIADAYWRSKVFVGPNRRWFDVHVERDTLTDTPMVQVTSSRQTSTVTLASGKRHARLPAFCQGWEHDLKLTLAENSAPVRRIVVTEHVPTGRRLKA